MKAAVPHLSQKFLGLLISCLFFFNLAIAAEEEATLPVKDVQRFTKAISQIKSYYVEPISDTELFNQAIRGMLNGLDPHSSYLDEDEFRQLTSTTSGEFGGLGIEVTMENGIIKVITPIEDTPAAQAGVKSGDLIIRLDNKPTKGMSLQQAVKKMRGKKGSNLKLTIVRKGHDKPLVINVKRDVIQIKSIKSKILDPGYGYVRLSYFQVPSADNLSKAIKLLKTQSGGNLKGLILDLRNNPGGLLDSAINVSDIFLDSHKLGANKTIVYTEGRVPGARFNAKATPGDILNNAPLVVLINQGSASGSEIVAGALQDHKRAILVGTTSFGKGSVQTVMPLDDLTGIKLTTALYFTPKGRSIQAKGIQPDIMLENVTVNKPKISAVEQMKEANLERHLLNANDAQEKTAKKTAAKSDDSLAYKDYPLYEALNILKGLAAAQANFH